jgi:hypothetical protein
MGTVTLQVPESQVIQWVRQLSPSGKQAVLKSLIPDMDEWESLVEYGDQRVRALYAERTAERGVNWDTLPDDERQKWVDELVGKPDSGCLV